MKNHRWGWLMVMGALILTGCAGGQGQETASTTTAPTPTTVSPTSTTTSVAADVGTWPLTPDDPYPAGEPVAWTGADLLVARAGCCDDLGSVDLSTYDPATNTWSMLPPTPLTPRGGAAGAPLVCPAGCPGPRANCGPRRRPSVG